jgi:hypothetical protein
MTQSPQIPLHIIEDDGTFAIERPWHDGEFNALLQVAADVVARLMKEQVMLDVRSLRFDVDEKNPHGLVVAVTASGVSVAMHAVEEALQP